MITRLALFTAFALCLVDIARAEPNERVLVTLLETIDANQHNTGDFSLSTYMEQKEKGKLAVVYEAQVYRRSADARFVMVFTEPKASQGQGYLRVDDNLWFYDPAVGKWSRRTERERIGGTDSRRDDFDESHLAEAYDPHYVDKEKLGAYDTIVLKLTKKPNASAAVAILKIWVDAETKNVLKREEYALSGRLLRTCYYPKWRKIYSQSKGGNVWFPQEIRVYDEVEKGNSTVLIVKSVDARPLESNLFTKAWLEGKSR